MSKNEPDYSVSKEDLLNQFYRELKFQDNILAGIYLVDTDSLALRCNYITCI